MRRTRQRGGRAQQELTRQVLARYGRGCWLKLPGCTKIATTKDHVVPYAQGGTDDLNNFRPACRSCNSKRQNRNYGGLVRVITGPPAAGKSTYVQENAHPSDVVIDLDRIARAFMPESNGGAPLPDQTGGGPYGDGQVYPAYIRHVAIGARTAAIQRATRLRERIGVWIIHSIPKPEQLEEYQRMGWQVISIDPGEQIVRERISNERSTPMQDVATKWYANETARDNESKPLTAPARDWGV